MLGFAHRRLVYIAALWREGVVAKWAGALWLAVGVFVLFRDDVLFPSGASQKWKLVSVILPLTPGQWLYAALLILLAWTFEASFRVQARMGAEKLELETRLSQIERSPIVILYDDSINLFTTNYIDGQQRGYALGSFAISVRNIGHKTLTEIRITIEGTGAEGGHFVSFVFAQRMIWDETPLVLSSDIHPGDTEQVPIITTPISGAYSIVGDENDLLSVPCKFQIRVSARDTKEAVAMFSYDSKHPFRATRI